MANKTDINDYRKKILEQANNANTGPGLVTRNTIKNIQDFKLRSHWKPLAEKFEKPPPASVLATAKFTDVDNANRKMILFPEKFNIKEMVKDSLDPNLIKHMKPEVLTEGKERLDRKMDELERYLYQNMMEGEQTRESTVTKTVEIV